MKKKIWSHLDVIPQPKSSIEIDRKVLSDLAVNQPQAFKALVEKAQSAR